MSVTKIRSSGLLARKRTRRSPCAATLISYPSGRLRLKDLPPESEIGCGVSFRGLDSCAGAPAARTAARTIWSRSGRLISSSFNGLPPLLRLVLDERLELDHGRPVARGRGIAQLAVHGLPQWALELSRGAPEVGYPRTDGERLRRPILLGDRREPRPVRRVVEEGDEKPRRLCRGLVQGIVVDGGGELRRGDHRHAGRDT